LYGSQVIFYANNLSYLDDFHRWATSLVAAACGLWIFSPQAMQSKDEDWGSVPRSEMRQVYTTWSNPAHAGGAL
jgi:hypothetical protein